MIQPRIAIRTEIERRVEELNLEGDRTPVDRTREPAWRAQKRVHVDHGAGAVAELGTLFRDDLARLGARAVVLPGTANIDGSRHARES